MHCIYTEQNISLSYIPASLLLSLPVLCYLKTLSDTLNYSHYYLTEAVVVYPRCSVTFLLLVWKISDQILTIRNVVSNFNKKNTNFLVMNSFIPFLQPIYLNLTTSMAINTFLYICLFCVKYAAFSPQFKLFKMSLKVPFWGLFRIPRWKGLKLEQKNCKVKMHF